MESMPKRATIIALGNVMAGDDGAGPWILDRLREAAPPGVELLAETAPGPEMIDRLAETVPLFFIDAAKPGHGGAGEVLHAVLRSGAAAELDATLAPAGRLVSTHGLSLREVLLLAEALGRRRAHVELWAVAGESFGPGEGLSPAVKAGAEVLARRLLERLLGGEPRAGSGEDPSGPARSGDASWAGVHSDRFPVPLSSFSSGGG